MTAGSGIIHSENSSDEFKRNGGVEEVLQLWINLPANLKMTKPKYIGLQKDEIPKLKFDNDKVTLNLISGKLGNETGAVDSLTDVFTSYIELKAGSVFNTNIEKERNILFYIVDGKVKVNDTEADKLNLVEFDNDNEELKLEALQNSVIIFCHGKPLNEPIVSYGPFVMNTQGEIKQAMTDYREGKFK